MASQPGARDDRPSGLTAEEGLPLVQFVSRPGVIDLGWGHPDPALLPVDGLREAAARALDRHGPAGLTYGWPAGPGPFREWVAERLARLDPRAPDPGAIVATAGNSQGLDLLVTLLTAPGDVVLVEEPTYHIALRILRDHPVELVGIPTDGAGLDIDALATIIGDLRREGRRPRLLYTVPTFSNPTGHSLSLERRQALVDLAADAGLRIVEDDPYRELAYDEPPPPSLWSLAPDGVVLRLVSFSKSLAPGLRTGCVVADRATAAQLEASGLLDSGGGISHFASLVVAEAGRSGLYVETVARLRTTYRARRDALADAVRVAVGSQGALAVPRGGYFLWLTLPGIEARRLLVAAEDVGMSFVPGGSFYLDGGGEASLRLGFTLYPTSELAEAAARLGRALKMLEEMA